MEILSAQKDKKEESIRNSADKTKYQTNCNNSYFWGSKLIIMLGKKRKFLN